MKIKSVLLGSAAALLLTIGVADAPKGSSIIGTSSAQAANVSISVGVFYSDLARYGDWVRYNNRYVFIPANVQDGWRPYTVGHWTYTKRYGWLWVSAEPFGWATYHYGRWGYSNDIGWYWVPGTKWAPAWVSWRRSADYISWAPLPPANDAGVIIDVSFGEVPEYYWTPVPAQSFLEINLAIVIINDNRERERIVRQSEKVGDVRIENNIVINNVIDVDFVEEKTKKEVKVVEVKESDKPELSDKRDGNNVTVFQGDVQAEPDAKPSKTIEVDAAKQIQGKRKNKPTENAAQTDGSGQAERPQSSDGKPAVSDEEGQTNGEAGKGKKPGVTEKPAAETPAKAEGPDPDKSKKQGGDQAEQKPSKVETEAGKNQNDTTTRSEDSKDKPAGKKPDQSDDASSSAGKSQQEENEKPRKDKKSEKCDPSTDADCTAEAQ
jgi:hypothetical protein